MRHRRRALLAAAAGCAALVMAAVSVQAHDDGRYANSPLKPWFDSLHSKAGGACCSNADGMALADVDWDTRDGHYRVRLDGEWIDVPADSVITEPNRAGRTMVWPYYVNGHPLIRCFLPGTMT
ncbi:hypothetical protein [Bradyrhizobium sp.]|uniref:hypothetical protein n=1 Tax=Bradyrhizobium sp. TaxID=376 RepID=UPI0039C88BC2